MLPASSGARFLQTLGLVALATIGMFTVDTFLAKTEESESRVEAARLFAEGQRLLDRGEFAKAAGPFQDALAIQRDNRNFLLALARAQLGQGQYADAEASLNALLLTDSTNGPANLNLARVLVKSGRIGEAISYYHRAIYGSWPDDPETNRFMARIELIDLLAQHNSKEELLGELLAVEDQTPDDLPGRLRMGKLFLTAGSPVRAAAFFQEILRQHPPAEPAIRAAAYDGLGEADFARGDYPAAANQSSSALKLNPQDTAAARRLDQSNRVLEMDPALRGLELAERYRRSHALLEAAVNALEPCASQDLLDKAHKSLNARAGALRQDARAESDLDLAEQLWQTRTPGCGPGAEDPLALVLAKNAAR